MKEEGDGSRGTVALGCKVEARFGLGGALPAVSLSLAPLLASSFEMVWMVQLLSGTLSPWGVSLPRRSLLCSSSLHPLALSFPSS